MEFSFVIPTYNNKTLLRNTLEALNYQKGFNRKDYEVIIVDDGSTDDTWETIQEVNQNYELKYYYLPRNNLSCRAKTRNYGWKNASGEIIVFIDSDILIKSDYLSELKRFFSKSTDFLVFGTRLMLNESVNLQDISSGKVFRKYQFDSENFNILEYRYFLLETSSYNAKMIMLPWTQVYSCNMAVPKKWLELIGGFDENFKDWGLEDIELGYALYEKKIQIAVNSKLEVLHQNHGEGNDLIIKKEKMPGYERNLAYFLKKHPQAVKMEKKYAFRFFKGEISDSKLFMDLGTDYLYINFREPDKLEYIKDLVLNTSMEGKRILVINDYTENTDLDVWLQLPRKENILVKYYPASKRLDRKKMINFLKMEKKRLKELESF